MNLIKVKFLRSGHPSGRPYTYESPVSVEVGNLVQINETSIGEVVEIDVPVAEIEAFRGQLKSIIGIAKAVEPEEVVTQ